MSVTVFVWNPSLSSDNPSISHASMQIDGGEYISLWPAPGRSRQAFATTRTRDIGLEKRDPSWTSAPITCLDEDAIRRWWLKLAGRSDTLQDEQNGGRYTRPGTGSYNLAFRNCADVVIEGLKAGGMMKFPAAVAAYYGHKLHCAPIIPTSAVVTTPADVRSVAIALSRNPTPLHLPDVTDSTARALREAHRYGGI